RAIARIEAIDIATADLALRLAALVGRADAIARIGEPDRAVGFHHDVIRRVEALALVAVREDRDASVVFRADHPSAAVLAGDQATLPVAGVAVGEVRIRTEHRDLQRLLVEAQDPVVGEIAEQETALIGEINRTFGPAQARV